MVLLKSNFEELVEVVEGGVVEGEARCLTELRIAVLEPLGLQLRVQRQDLRLRRLQDAVDAPDHREGEDHVLVLAALEAVPEQLGDAPDEADPLGEVVHGHLPGAAPGSES